MAKRIFAFLALLLVVVIGFYKIFPASKKAPTQPATPPSGMEWFQGNSMKIMLPSSYQERQVRDDLPRVIETIKWFTGGDNGLLGGLLDNIEQNVAWWGWDSETLEENPLRLLVIKNKALHAVPITAAAYGLEYILNNEETKVEQNTVQLGGRSVVRFKYVTADHAWIAYAFKEQDYLWLNLFRFTPEGLIGAQSSFEESVSTIQIDPVGSEEK